ncbi:uncharacterized protein B0J16DRAFT_313367 [Fusarium flagelliforme]|uniref:uncharacterized protein n=1 Tax=Fusarium flagelliforme TaxID=2675880 RepID=UPI001E8CF393|nr:uncharacterized protein B0J16DRAFT_313367 [Fusarium flagelliforme]KAH7197039.1 hypothetical protein B0J16DRAFT_313367 [Fusarium flagelliforme]
MATDHESIHQMSGGSDDQLLSPPQGEAAAAQDVSTPQDTPTPQDASSSQETPTLQGSSGHGAGTPNSVVEIRDTNTERGRGLFATRDLFKRYRIIDNEEPIFNTFPILHNIPTDRALRTGRPNKDEEWEKLLERFKREYGFGDIAGRGSHFYALACHINHGCENCANARFVVGGPFCINVLLKKPVRVDEEILVNYGKENLTHGCARCATSTVRKRRLKRLLKTAGHKLNPRNWLRKDEREQ